VDFVDDLVGEMLQPVLCKTPELSLVRLPGSEISGLYMYYTDPHLQMHIYGH